MKAEKIEKLQKLLEEKKHVGWDIENAEYVLSHGPYSIQGKICSASIPAEYARAMLKAHIRDLTQRLAEIDKELEDL